MCRWNRKKNKHDRTNILRIIVNKWSDWYIMVTAIAEKWLNQSSENSLNDNNFPHDCKKFRHP